MDQTEDIIFFKGDFTGQKTSSYSKGDFKGLMLHASFEGSHGYKSYNNNYEIKVNEKDITTIDIVNTYEGLSDYNNTKMIVMLLDKSYLEKILPSNKYSDKIFEFFEKKDSIKNLKNLKTSINNRKIVKELYNNPFNKDLESLFIESKKLEFVYEELKSIFKPQKEKSYKNTIFSSQDKEAIYYAYEVLKQNLSNPPTIKELSKIVKINEFKLKAGFKVFFNSSVYQESLENRLQEAKKLLDNSELNINEIALSVGYKYSENFSNAFFKRFKVRPKDLMKSRKYYY